MNEYAFTMFLDNLVLSTQRWKHFFIQVFFKGCSVDAEIATVYRHCSTPWGHRHEQDGPGMAFVGLAFQLSGGLGWGSADEQIRNERMD